MRTIEATVKLHTAPGLLWKSIIDREASPRHVSMLSEVKIVDLTGSDVNTVRQCTLRGGKSFMRELRFGKKGVPIATSGIARKHHSRSSGPKLAGAFKRRKMARGFHIVCNMNHDPYLQPSQPPAAAVFTSP